MKIPAKYLPINDNEEEVTTDITGINRLIISMESADNSDDAIASEACEGGNAVLDLRDPFLGKWNCFSLLKGIFVFVFCFLSCLLLTLLSFSLFPGISEDLLLVGGERLVTGEGDVLGSLVLEYGLIFMVLGCPRPN